MKKLDIESYEAYRNAQSEANRLKFANVFATTEELGAIAAHHATKVGPVLSGLCHGVRNGFEVRFLRRALGESITGTDISESATEVPNCIVWDMHEVKPEWLNAIDFIYSNSWDHTYDAELLFERWASCLTNDGRLYVTWTIKHSEEGVTDETNVDTFGCTLDELVGILRRHCLLKEVLVSQPRSLARQVRRRYGYLRIGRWRAALARSLPSLKYVTLVLAKRVDA